ncbi:MAG: type II toxin-antitoxin system RelE family toxin [Terriglobia bacterium]
MAVLRMSNNFADAAHRLPKDARAKLAKVFSLLTSDPRHPSLQVKKIQGARRPDIYECRLNDGWRIILRDIGQMTFDLIYVGPHDEAISYGQRVSEAPALYDLPVAIPQLQEPLVSLVLVVRFLEGDDSCLQFKPVTSSYLRRFVAPSRRRQKPSSEESA